jgi:hypothetical protein
MFWRTDTPTTNVDGIAARETPRWRQNAPPKTATIDLVKAPEPAAQTKTG